MLIRNAAGISHPHSLSPQQAMANWSALPDLAVDAIANRLPLPVDYVRFRSVCSSWRAAAPRRFHFPWLVLHRRVDGDGDDTSLPTVISFSTLYPPGPTLRPLPLPSTVLPSHCCGASHGWLALLDRTPAVSLFNPLTAARITLPPFTRFTDCHGRAFTKLGEDTSVCTDKKTGETKRLRLIASKVVLSADPGATGEFVALAIRSCRILEFCRSGGDAWLPIEHPNLTGLIIDVFFYRGRFYVSSGYVFFTCWLGPSRGMAVDIPALDRPLRYYSSLMYIDVSYLVEAGGDLLLVTISFDNDMIRGNARYAVEVFKLDFQGKRLLKLKNVADYALFLDLNQSFALPVSKFPGLKGNHIYSVRWSNKTETRICVLNLEDCNDEGCSDEFLPVELAASKPNWSPCTWLRPSLLQ